MKNDVKPVTDGPDVGYPSDSADDDNILPLEYLGLHVSSPLNGGFSDYAFIAGVRASALFFHPDSSSPA